MATTLLGLRLSKLRWSLSTVQGAFEVENCLGGRAGRCLEQEITVVPTKWGSSGSPPPLALLGDPAWSDYRVTVDVLLEQSGSVDLMGRVVAQSQATGAAQGYHLQVSDNGTYSLLVQDAAAKNTILASGALTLPLSAWHTLGLDFSGTSITALFDGEVLTTVTDLTYSTGNVGLSTGSWIRAQFDNLAMTGKSRPVSDAGAVAACVAKPPLGGASGLSLVTDFASVANDGGVGAGSNFGVWSNDGSTFGGGTYFYPGMGPGTDSLADPAAGIWCTTLASQNSFVATAVPGTGWVLSGRVATFTGVGFYLTGCTDPSAFHGIEFTISGSVGSGAADAGMPNQMTFSVSTPADSKAGSGGGGTCTLPGCTSPSYTFDVPAQPTTIRVTWEMLRGGAPIFVLSPSAGITGLQWTLPWPCVTNPTPYDVNVTITDVSFF